MGAVVRVNKRDENTPFLVKSKEFAERRTASPYFATVPRVSILQSMISAKLLKIVRFVPLWSLSRYILAD